MSDTTKELTLAWNGGRKDTSTQIAGEEEDGYERTETVGYVFVDKDGPKGTVRIPLWRGYNQGRSDTRTIASASKEIEGSYHIYDKANQGYIYENPYQDTQPLCLAYNGDREDSLTKVGKKGEDNYGFDGGYQFIRVLGYIKT